MATSKYVEVEQMKAILKSHKQMCGSILIELRATLDIVHYDSVRLFNSDIAISNLERAIKYLEERTKHYNDKLLFLASASAEKLERINYYLEEMDKK